MKSQYIVQDWLPESEGYTYLHEVVDGLKGFNVFVQGEKNKYRIVFDSVYAYSCIDDGGCIDDPRRAGGLNNKNSFFKIIDSWYIEDVQSRQIEVLRETGLIHFAIYCSNQCLDILVYSNPKVEVFSGSVEQP